MNEIEVKAAIVEILGGIAPDVDFATVAADAHLRRAVELDSMDFLSFVVKLHERFGVDIAESEYAQMATLSQCVALVQQKLGAR